MFIRRKLEYRRDKHDKFIVKKIYKHNLGKINSRY